MTATTTVKLLLPLLLLTNLARAETIWRGATEYPATAMPGEGLATFARLLAEHTDGQIKLEPRFDAPDGLRSATIPSAVEQGKLDVGDTFAGAIASLDPIFQLSSLPFLATTQDEAWRLFQVAKPAYERALARHGQRLLYATPWPASGIWSRDPLTGPEPLNGLAVRTYDATSTAVLNGAGAKAVEYSFADAMPHLQDGSVTAVLSSGDGGAGRKLWDYTSHFTAIGYAMPLSLATVSTAAYDSLAPERRHQVDMAAAATEEAQWQLLIQRTERNYATMRANRVDIGEASPALAVALAKAAAAVRDEWRARAGPAAAGILEAYTATR